MMVRVYIPHKILNVNCTFFKTMKFALRSLLLLAMQFFLLWPYPASCFVNLEKIHNGITYSMIDKILEGDLKYYSNDIHDKRDKGDHSRAKVHSVITKPMRRALIKELRYLPEEVDSMNAQIAAVVLERALERPKNGMPSPWRFDYYAKIFKKRPLQSVGKEGASTNNANTLSSIFMHLPKATKYVVPFLAGLMVRANFTTKVSSKSLEFHKDLLPVMVRVETASTSSKSTGVTGAQRAAKSSKELVPLVNGVASRAGISRQFFRVAKQILYLIVVYYRAPGFIINYSR
jgi:hypothetical protein